MQENDEVEASHVYVNLWNSRDFYSHDTRYIKDVDEDESVTIRSVRGNLTEPVKIEVGLNIFDEADYFLYNPS